jgi:hypothetical protein
LARFREGIPPPGRVDRRDDMRGCGLMTESIVMTWHKTGRFFLICSPRGKDSGGDSPRGGKGPVYLIEFVESHVNKGCPRKKLGRHVKKLKVISTNPGSYLTNGFSFGNSSLRSHCGTFFNLFSVPSSTFLAGSLDCSKSCGALMWSFLAASTTHTS